MLVVFNLTAGQPDMSILGSRKITYATVQASNQKIYLVSDITQTGSAKLLERGLYEFYY